MKIVARSAAVVAGVLFALLFLGSQVQAKPEYAKKEKKACSFCHVGKPADMKLTKAGQFYAENHTLKDFSEAGKAPPAGGGAPAPSGGTSPSSTESRPSADTQPGSGAVPGGMMQGSEGVRSGHPMMEEMKEEMKAHAAEMQKAIAELQEHEKALETLGDWPQAKPVIVEHLRMLDNVMALRGKSMNSMMERMHRKNMMEKPGDAGPPPAPGGGEPSR